MGESRAPLFRGRHFRDEIIVLCVRWYLRYPLSYRHLEEMMAERGLPLHHCPLGPQLRSGPERAHSIGDAAAQRFMARR